MIFELPAGEVSKKIKKSHSRWGGVAKIVFRTPTLGADQQKITTPMQHGNAKIDFCDTSRAKTLVSKMM